MAAELSSQFHKYKSTCQLSVPLRLSTQNTKSGKDELLLTELPIPNPTFPRKQQPIPLEAGEMGYRIPGTPTPLSKIWMYALTRKTPNGELNIGPIAAFASKEQVLSRCDVYLKARAREQFHLIL